MQKLTQVAICLGLLVSTSPARAELLSDGNIEVDVLNQGFITSVELGGILMDQNPLFPSTSCGGFQSGSAVTVSGTTATYTATCGNFDVAATVRLLAPLPSQPVSGGFEAEYRFTNNTLVPLPLTYFSNWDPDLMSTSIDDVAAYDAATGAAFVTDTVADPDALIAVIAATDFAGASFGFDVDVLGLVDLTFPTDNGVGPVGPTDVGMSMGFDMEVPAGQSAGIYSRAIYARGTTTVPADFDFASCYSTPSPDCRVGAKSLLLVKNNAIDAKDKFVWKSSNGEATSQADFADPTVDGSYNLCIYDGASDILMTARTASSAVAWSALPGDKGYIYKDKTGASSGITKSSLKAGDDGKTKIQFSGAGTGLPDPTLGGITMPIVVSLQNNDNPGECWKSTFNAATRNDASQLKAKAP